MHSVRDRDILLKVNECVSLAVHRISTSSTLLMDLSTDSVVMVNHETWFWEEWLMRFDPMSF